MNEDIKKYSRRLFVGGLEASVNEELLRDYFSKFGCIVDVTLMINPDNGVSKCYGFVECKDQHTANSIVEQKHEINGRQVDVNFAFKKCKGTAIQWKDVLNKRKIFVTGLKYRTEEHHLQKYFSKFGEVRKTYLITDPDDSTKIKDFGYVEFVNESSVNIVINIGKHYIRGKRVACYRFKFRDELYQIEQTKKEHLKQHSNDQIVKNKHASFVVKEKKKSIISMIKKNEFFSSVVLEEENMLALYEMMQEQGGNYFFRIGKYPQSNSIPKFYCFTGKFRQSQIALQLNSQYNW